MISQFALEHEDFFKNHHYYILNNQTKLCFLCCSLQRNPTLILIDLTLAWVVWQINCNLPRAASIVCLRTVCTVDSVFSQANGRLSGCLCVQASSRLANRSPVPVKIASNLGISSFTRTPEINQKLYFIHCNNKKA